MNHYTLKFLIIEHNPLLDDGRRASELVNMTDKIHPAVEELMDDIKFSSHGLVDCEIVGWETVDEFPRHTCTFRLESGESHALDSATVKKLFENGWYRYARSALVSASSSILSRGISQITVGSSYKGVW